MDARLLPALLLGVSTAWSASGPLSELERELALPSAVTDQAPSQHRYSDWPPPSLVASPYWLAWEEQSFHRAVLFARPVLLVLGTEWSAQSRAMFEGPLADERVLSTANRGFVSVRADADRRPEIRERYATGESPVIAFLLPNGQPMLRQAHDPAVSQPITMSGLPAEQLAFLLSEGVKYWDKSPELLLQAARRWTAQQAEGPARAGAVDALAADQVADWLLAHADLTHGGFGSAPKSLVTGLTEFAMLRSARLREELHGHARFTLERLLESPLYDRVGGGIHRTARAPAWGAIQTEKTLAANAALLRELTTARRTGLLDARAALEQTARFVLDTLGRPGGGFHNAQYALPLESDSSNAAARRANGGTPDVQRLVLSGNTALAAAALARAGLALGNPEMMDFARGSLDWLLGRAYSPRRGVTHVVEPDPDPTVYLMAQAEVALGLLDAYEIFGDPRHLDAARDLVDFALINLATGEAAALIDHLPGPRPAGLLASPRRPLHGNTQLARAALRLAHHGLGSAYRDRAVKILEHFCGDLTRHELAGTLAGLAVEETIREPLTIRISGKPSSARAALRGAALQSAWPWTLVTTGDEAAGEPSAELVWLERSRSVDDPLALDRAVRALTGLEAP